MDRNTQHNNYLRAHILRSRWYRVFIAAAAIVVFITTYMLILPAITLDAKCGKEEHTHAETCYAETEKLVCKQDETPGHTHSDDCYQTTDILSCGLEESEPVVEEIVNEETGEVETVVVSEGHTHDESCYTQDTELICGQEESEGHTHTDSCYKKEKNLVCKQEEHKHTDSCYHEPSDPNADVENADIWTQTFANVQLTGNWGEDIVAIAKTQVGYQESSRNFIYDQDDEKDGYTRYGAWYGDPYGEWCAMFASFNIYYAQVGQDEFGRSFPLEANCANWINKLTELGYYHNPQDCLYMDQLGRETYTGKDYFVKPGDLIFFKLDQESGKISDHVGIVTNVTDKKIYTIQGNSNYSVLEKDYNVGDVSIVGFGEIPENPNYVDPNKEDTNEPTPTKEPVKKSVSKAKVASGISLMSMDDANGTPHDFKNDITNIYVSVNGTYLTPEGGAYQVKQNDTVNFDIEYTLPGNTLTNTNTITYKVPTNGLTYQSGTVMGTLNGQSVTAGDYTVNTDGTITIVFNDAFVNQNKAGNPVTGTITLHETASNITGSDSNDGHIPFKDGMDYNFHITDRTIKNYDLSLKKTQGTINGNKQTYTIEVSTTKGTDGQQVSLSDTLEKMHISGNVTIKDKNNSTIATITDKSGQGSFNYNLPAMNGGDKYTITYEAELNSDQTADQVQGKNTAKAEFTDHDGNKYDPSQTIQTNFNRTVISKNGNQNGTKIDWTITLNNSHQNIAGWVMTDEMMKGQDITVTGGNASDYTYDKANGTLTFNDNGNNTNSYTVTFSTPIADEQYGTNVKNTAIFKDKSNNPHPAEKEVWTNRPADNNPLYKSGQKLADGRIEWTIVVDGKQEDIANQVLKDDAFKDPTFQITSVVRNYYNGDYDPTQDYTLDKNAGTITFKPTENGENKNRYEIKYTVMPTYEWGHNSFTNVGQLGNHTPVTGNADGGDNPPGSKTGKGYETQNDTVILKWHASVGGALPLEASWTFEDWLDSGDGYFTMDQLKAIEATIRSANINNFTMIAYPDASHSNNGETVNAAASSSTHFQKYKITFNDTLAANRKLEWDYQSVGLGTDTTNTYNNHAKINDHWQYDASIPYEHKPTLKKTNMWGTTLKYNESDPNMNYINWLLEVNIPAGTTDTEWTITEHVPAGLNPVYIDPVLVQNNQYPEDTNFAITSSKNEDGDYIIKFNPSLYAGQTKYIKVAGLVRASEIPMNADKTTAVKVYQNSASITYSDGKTYDAPPVDKRVEREYSDNTLAKGAQFDEATGIITYHIDIDPEKVVVPEDKSYSVVDEISYNHGFCKLEIVPGSITVKESLTGRVLNASECLIIEGDVQDDGQGNYKQKIYFSIVSDQPICIEYKYQYQDVTTELWGHGVHNHVTLENDRGWHSETDHDISNHYKSSDATAEVNSYTVYKVDAADHTTLLPGATFDIYKWNDNSKSYVKDATATTQPDGSLRHPNGFTRNVAYRIVETSAPTGYTVNSNPMEFYTQNKNTVKYPLCIPEDFTGTVLREGGAVLFEDTRVEGDRDTQIAVKKNWVDHEGNDISNSVNTDIQFTLKQIEKKYRGSGSSGSDAIPGVVAKLQYSDGRYETIFMEDVCIGDSINAKVLHEWNIITEDGSVDPNWGDQNKPTYNGTNDDSKAYNGTDKKAYCFPIVVNSRVITIYTPYNANNNVHIGYEKTSSGSGSGSGTAELISTNESTIGTYTISKSSGYLWNSSTLPAYKINGDGTSSVYTYYVVEQNVQGYITNYDRNDSVAGVGAGTITITNTRPNVDENTELTVRKVWRDAENNLMIDEEIPESAVIEIWQVANGDKANATKLEDKTVTLNRSNNWQTTINQLPKVRRNGNDVVSYTYYFVEQTQTGYEVTYSNGDTALGQGTVIVTNKKTDTPEDKDTSITVEKVWKDKDGNTITAPDGQTIIMDLYQIIDDGEPTKLDDKSVTLPDNGNWSKTVADLPLTRVDEENSAVEHQYKYYFVEREVPVGYEVSYTNDDKKPVDKGTVTVTNKKTTGITVNKQWLNADGADITDSMGDASVNIELIQVETGSGSGGGQSSGSGQASNYGQPCRIQLQAQWPSSTEYNLPYDVGSVITSYTIGSTVRFAWRYNDSQWTPGSIPIIVNGTTYTSQRDGTGQNNSWNTYYTDVTLTGDTTVTFQLDGGGFSYDGSAPTVSLIGEAATPSGGNSSGSGNDQGGSQDAGTVYGTAALSRSNNWTHTFTNLPTTGKNASNQDISYTYYVKEVAVPNYETTYTNNGGITDGVITVINKSTRKPEYTEVTIEKEWKGSDGEPLGTEALANKSAKFKLMAFSGNDKSQATQYGDIFTVPENGSWTKTFTNLPKKTYDSDGNAINWKYYFEEIAPEEGTEVNYQKETIFNFLPFVDGSENAEDQATSGGTVKVTNTITPETTTISVEKKWKDAQGNDSVAPQSPDKVTVDLYKITDNQGTGVKVNEAAIELNAGNNWRWDSATALGEDNQLIKKEYVDGVEHTYTYYFVETAVAGYTTAYQSGTSEAVEDATTIPVSEGTFRVINKEVPKTSVTVTKKWFRNENGTTTEITDKTGYIEFDLYRVATRTGGDEPTHQHSWDGGVVTVEPGEYTEGVRTYTCTECGETRTEPIGALGHTHSWSNSVTTAATCTSTGVRTYICSGCGDTYTEEIHVNPSNHAGGTYTDGYLAPTATTDGHEANTYCSGCHAMLQAGAVIPATGGGEDPAGTVTITLSNYGTAFFSKDVTSGANIRITGVFKQTWGTPNITVSLNSTTSVNYDVDNSGTYPVYSFVYTANESMNFTMELNSGLADWEWSIDEISRARSSAPRMMSAPRNAPAPSSETPTIPDGAQHLGTKQIHSTSGWVYSETFPAEEGYTYTYYVVEENNPNYSVTYDNEGSTDVTINNTEVVNSYELPHTGGSGTKLITMLGILLMAAASSLMIIKKHRKEEIW